MTQQRTNFSDETNTELATLSKLDVLNDVCLGRKSGTEENIKIKIVLRVLNLLGYDTTADMDFEHHVYNRRADVALLIDSKPKVIVETKSLEKKLDEYKVQALEYARKEGISWSVLTNGEEIRLYKSFIEDVADYRNKPIFTTSLKSLPRTFQLLDRLISKYNVRDIEQRTKTTVEEIRKAVTEEELLETLHNARQILFKDIYEDFVHRYENDKDFTAKIDGWKKIHEEDLKYDWQKLYQKDKNFRSQVDSVIGLENIDEDWLELYKADRDAHVQTEFSAKINSILRENDIQTDWIDKLCSEGTYAFINRILFLRICEDRKFIRTQTTPEWIKILETSSFDETVRNLLRELFGTVSEKFKFY